MPVEQILATLALPKCNRKLSICILIKYLVTWFYLRCQFQLIPNIVFPDHTTTRPQPTYQYHLPSTGRRSPATMSLIALNNNNNNLATHTLATVSKALTTVCMTWWSIQPTSSSWRWYSESPNCPSLRSLLVQSVFGVQLACNAICAELDRFCLSVDFACPSVTLLQIG